MNNNKLNYLVIHCTNTPEGKRVTKDDIIRQHTLPKHLGGQGLNRPAFTDMVYLNGDLVNIVPPGTEDFVDLWEIANGVNGLTGNSRHIAYTGGMDENNKQAKDTRSPEQIETLEIYVKYTVKRHPKVQVLGFNEAPNALGQDSPGFKAGDWLRSIGIPDENIYHKPGPESGSEAMSNLQPGQNDNQAA